MFVIYNNENCDDYYKPCIFRLIFVYDIICIVCKNEIYFRSVCNMCAQSLFMSDVMTNVFVMRITNYTL